MIDQTFGRLTVKSFSHRDTRHRKFFRCECSCGEQATVQGSLLRVGNTKSCGCLHREGPPRSPENQGAITAIILGYKRHARDRGIEWHLSRDEVSSLVRQPCHYCGIAAGNLKRTKNLKEGFPHNGIDRMDATKPYVATNVVPCCGFCNRAKGVLTHDEFISWAFRIAEKHA